MYFFAPLLIVILFFLGLVYNSGIEKEIGALQLEVRQSFEHFPETFLSQSNLAILLSGKETSC